MFKVNFIVVGRIGILILLHFIFLLLKYTYMRKYKKMVPTIKRVFKCKNRKSKIHFGTIFRPIYIWLSLFGLFPYGVTYNKSKNQFRILNRTIYLNILTASIVLIVMFVFLALHIHFLYISSATSSMTDAMITQMNYVLELALITLYCAVAYASAFANRWKFIKIINDLLVTWYDLQCQESEEILFTLQNRIKFVNFTLVFLLLLQVAVNFTRGDSFWKVVLVSLSFNLPEMIQFVHTAYYYLLIMIVVAVLKNINALCLKHDAGKKVSIFNESNFSVFGLRRLEMLYSSVFKIKQEVNLAFQGPILICTIQCFHSMVSEAHIIYHGAIVYRTMNVHEIANCSIWLLYQVAKIYALAFSGNLLKYEAAKINKSLHKIPLENQDVRFVMEVQHFSSMMSCQGIDLTVYGFFPIDATLLYNIIASATMYFIILVQFDK